MIDTHTHLYMPEYDDGGESVVKAAIKEGVEKLVFPAVDMASLDLMR